MNLRLSTLLPLLAVAVAGLSTPRLTAGEKAIERIAFGSCLRQDRDVSIFDQIASEKPDLFVFLGDNVYGDSENMEVIRAKYELLDSREEFALFRNQVPLLATWDDHDYGANDAGAEYPKKVESEALFLDFWQVPKDAPSRSRPGIYDARLHGPEGQRVQVILLDTRFFRDALEPREKRDRLGPWKPTQDQTKTVLGEAQWTWLREQLLVPAKFRIVATSIQLIPEDHRYESWSNFPHERQRMFDLIGETKAGGVVFLSGDRHLAELSMLKAGAEEGPGWRLLEATSSGLTHAGGGQDDEPNRHRIKGGNFRGRNYGVIDFNWEKKSIRVQIKAEDGVKTLSWVGPRHLLAPPVR